MGKLDLSDEEKQRRSQNMRQLHADGRAGGAKFGKMGGRPKKRRISESLVDEYQGEVRMLKEKLDELLESKSEKTRLDTIKFIGDLEERERKAQVEEEVRYDQLKQGELAELVIGNLFELVRSGQIDLGEVIDGEAVEIRGSIGTGKDDNGTLEEAEDEGATD